jgi:hypothetical protein
VDMQLKSLARTSMAAPRGGGPTGHSYYASGYYCGPRKGYNTPTTHLITVATIIVLFSWKYPILAQEIWSKLFVGMVYFPSCSNAEIALLLRVFTKVYCLLLLLFCPLNLHPRFFFLPASILLDLLMSFLVLCLLLPFFVLIRKNS